jgi:hypothetical protein
MGKKKENLDKLLEMARKADSENLSDPIWKLLRIPVSRNTIKEILDNIFQSIRKTKNESERAKALEALFILVKAVYTSKDPKRALSYLKRTLRDSKAISKDETKKKWLEEMYYILRKLHLSTSDELRVAIGPPEVLHPQDIKKGKEREELVGEEEDLETEEEVEEPEDAAGAGISTAKLEEPKPPRQPSLEPPLPPLPPLEPPPRYADFAFYYEDRKRTGQKVPGKHTLRAEHWYQLEVAVRVKPTGIPPKQAKRRPIREPKQKQDVTIMVAAEGDGFEISENVQTLTLPPLGDSTRNAWFRVRPLHKSPNINTLAQIKLRLYYEFNLLEVVVISAEVVGKFESPAKSLLGLEKPMFFRQETLEREYIDFDNIQPRAMHIHITKQKNHFLFNFAFKNNIDQKVVFPAPAHLTASDLESDLVSIRNIWHDIAMSKTFSKQIEGKKNEFLVNVRKLAIAGRRLWIKLFKRKKESSMYKIGMWLERHPLKHNAKIQVSIKEDAANFVFPWSLIYDRSRPRKKYELPDLDGFWGVRYCIEQHLPGRKKRTDEPVRLRKELKLEFMLWEQFRNADKQKDLMKRMVSASAGKLEVSSPPITDANACYDLLCDCGSHVLYFYSHGFTRHRRADIGVSPNLDLFLRKYDGLDKDSPLRETYRMLYESIKQGEFESDRSWIELSYGKLYLDELYDDVENLESGPFVILNMCESAQITPSLSDSFIHFFLDRGATSVLGTECPMTVEFAHPFAEKFLKAMLSGVPVGIALLNARRHFLKLKNPLGLAYSLFGSATVCFKPPRFQLSPTLKNTKDTKEDTY